MEKEQLQLIFEDKYQELLGLSFAQWEEKGPKTEAQAFARCSMIDRELNRTYDEWFESTGDKKAELQDYREKLKTEYDLIEDTFHLEANDRDW